MEIWLTFCVTMSPRPSENININLELLRDWFLIFRRLIKLNMHTLYLYITYINILMIQREECLDKLNGLQYQPTMIMQPFYSSSFVTVSSGCCCYFVIIIIFCYYNTHDYYNNSRTQHIYMAALQHVILQKFMVKLLLRICLYYIKICFYVLQYKEKFLCYTFHLFWNMDSFYTP